MGHLGCGGTRPFDSPLHRVTIVVHPVTASTGRHRHRGRVAADDRTPPEQAVRTALARWCAARPPGLPGRKLSLRLRSRPDRRPELLRRPRPGAAARTGPGAGRRRREPHAEANSTPVHGCPGPAA
ncbi:predicted protein [Streptomyces sp. C]|nr:predicted protein [Streptomyces sp. C]